MKQLKLRIQSLWHILTKRNFIIIFGIKEFVNDKGEKGRGIKLIRRTDYGGDSDYLSCVGAARMCQKQDGKIQTEDYR